jgi:hypothetical protein
MIPLHRRLTLVALAAAVALLASSSSPDSADAQKKKKKGGKVKPACGLKVLPFAEGVEWKYQYYVPEGVQLPPGVRVQDPPEVTIKVTKVAKAGRKTVISLEESYRKVNLKTELTCDKDGLIVPPESFFFAGQPGGGVGMTVGKVDRKAETNVFAGGKLKGEAFEELKTDVKREPSPGTGAVLVPSALEIERKMKVLPGQETVESGITSHKATRLTIQMTGRATLETTKDKPFNVPTLDVAMFFAPDVGIVQVRNSQGQGWKLAQHKMPGEDE